jgi:hypothetical protein
LKKNHLDEQYVARRAVRDLPSTITGLNERLTKLTSDEAIATAHAGDPVTIGKRGWSRDAAPDVLGQKLEHLPRNVSETTRVPIGMYRGLRFGLVLHPSFAPDVYLEGALTRQTTLTRDHQGPRAVLNALERIATGYGSESVRLRQDLAIAESQLRDYRERLGKPFPHEAYLSALTELRDQLKAALFGGNSGSDDETRPSTFGLAEKIKVLKAASTIEATSQRIRQKQASAEEPVSARIRRHQEEANSTGDQSKREPASPEPKALSFQERILRELTQNGEGQSPS